MVERFVSVRDESVMSRVESRWVTAFMRGVRGGSGGRCRPRRLGGGRVLSPAVEPAEPRAEVLLLREAAPPEPEGEIIGGGPVVRRTFQTTFTVR